MKKSLLFLLLAVSTFVACDKAKELLTINKNLEYNGSVDVTGVPGIPDSVTVLPPNGINANFPEIANETKAQQYIEEYNTSPDKISNVIVSQMTLTMSGNQNFDFLDTIRVYINATGLSEKLLGYKYDIAKGTQTLDLDRKDENIKDYFLKDSIFFRINGHFIDIPDSGSKMDLTSVFSLVANPVD